MLKKVRNYVVIGAVSLLGVMTMTACGGDDDDDLDDVIGATVNAKGLVGKWKLMSQTGWEKYRGEIVDSWDYVVGVNTMEERIFEFKSNGVAILPNIEDDDVPEIYWKVLGEDRLVLTFIDSVSGYEAQEAESYKFTLSGNELTIISQEDDKDGYSSYDEMKFMRIK